MQMGFLQSATLTSIENVAVEIYFFPPLEEMASSHKQNACRLHILPVKCLKTPPAGIGQWNVLRNRTFYRNVGSLKCKSHLPLTAGGCAPSKDCKMVLARHPGVSEHHRPVVTWPLFSVQKVHVWWSLSFKHPLVLCGTLKRKTTEKR